MAITRTLTKAVPFENTSDEVERWELEMKYSQGTEGTSDYYENTFEIDVEGEENNGTVNFTNLDKTTWSLADLEALCPTNTWDNLFDAVYDSVITNPPEVCVPDPDYVIPIIPS